MGKFINKIPQRLIQKEMRDQQRYSQHDMAVGTGINDATVSRIMNYETLNKVSFESIVRIAEWLGVNPLDLFEEVEE